MFEKLLGEPKEPQIKNEVKLTFNQYEQITRQILCRLLKKQKHLLNNVLSSQENFTNCVYAVMWADWTHEESKSDIKTYRYNAVKWMIFQRLYVKRNTKASKLKLRNIEDYEKMGESYDDIYFSDEIKDYDIFYESRPYLTDQEYKILCLRFKQSMTYREIGEQLKVSKQTAAIYCKSAIKKLKSKSRINKLFKDYICQE